MALFTPEEKKQIEDDFRFDSYSLDEEWKRLAESNSEVAALRERYFEACEQIEKLLKELRSRAKQSLLENDTADVKG